MKASDFDELVACNGHDDHKLVINVVTDQATGVVDSIDLDCDTCMKNLMSLDKGEDCKCESVFMLNIMHRFGVEMYIFRDEELAHDQLYLYVKDAWREEFPGDPCPEDKRQAIYEYFADNECESFIITEQPVLEEVET